MSGELAPGNRTRKRVRSGDEARNAMKNLLSKLTGELN